MNRKNLFRLCAALLTYGFLELLSFAGLRIFQKVYPTHYDYIAPFRLTAESKDALKRLVRGECEYLCPDAAGGWTIQPNAESKGIYRSNSQGIRADGEFPLEPPADKLRIALFGDSFTHGDDVPLEDTWAYYLQSQESRFEVLNFGVGGYGLDQAYVRYEIQGKRFRPKVVLIDFMSENIRRHVNTFRPFYNQASGFVFTKPRFRPDQNGIELIPNPFTAPADYRALLENEKQALEKIGREDYYYQRYHRNSRWTPTPLLQMLKFAWSQLYDLMPGPAPITRGRSVYNRDSEAYRVTLRLIERFQEEVRQDGAEPLIVIFPDRRDFQKIQKGKPPVYQPLLEDLQARGYPVVDVLDAFREHKDRTTQELYGVDRHYTALGNRLAGELILKRLRELS